MNLITHKELKPRTSYKRNYDNNGKFISVELTKTEIEELVDSAQIFGVIKWLNKANTHLARIDVTVNTIANKIAKQVLTKEEMRSIQKHPYPKKELSLLSDKTYETIGNYVLEWQNIFEREGWLKTFFLNYNKFYWKDGRKRTYEELTISARVTEEGYQI